jgi:hypothetical protein
MSKYKITVNFFDENDNEIQVSFPAKNEVCPRCEGHGYHLREAIGSHAYSAEEFYESFPGPEDREEYFRRGGIYDVQCEKCKGANVIAVVDEKLIERCGSEEEKANLKKYHKHLEQEEKWRAEAAAEARMERMMMGDYD